MANPSYGGFRHRGNRLNPRALEPRIEIVPVASAYATAMYKGDPVKRAADGTLQVAAPGDRVFGVFDGAEAYWDGTVLKKGPSIPAGTTYGSVVWRTTLARVILAEGQIFEVDADDGVTATTQAAHEAFLNENCEWATGAPTGENSGAVLDISTHATTNTLSCRIVDIPNKGLQDFASSRVKYYVVFNLTQNPAPGTTTGS